MMKSSIKRALFFVGLIAAAWSTHIASGGQPLRIGFSFNEGTQAGSGGVVIDYYGTVNGTFTGTWSGATYFRPGFSGEEGDFSFTSAGNRVRVDANSVLGTNWGSFTIESHFTIGEVAGFRRLVDIHGFQPALEKNGSNQLRTNLGTSAVVTSALEEGRWYHAAVVFDADAGQVRLYLDGGFVGSQTARPWIDPVRLVVGAGDGGGSAWNGLIDNVRFTQAALTPEQFLLAGFGTDLTEPPPPPEPLPDAAQLQLFWTELDLGEIQTARADGTGRATLVSGLNRPIGIQVDQENGYIYWAEDGALGQTGNGRIARTDLDGGNVTTLFAAVDGDIGLDNPQHIAIDPDGGMIYWADFTTGIYRGAIDGSGAVQPVYVANWERYTNVALDLVNNHVYFGHPQRGDLWRTDLNGDNFQWAATSLTGNWGFNGLAVDPVAGKVYFPDTASVRSANLDGSQSTELATALGVPLGVALAPDRQRIFYAERGGQSIGVVYTDGTQQQRLLTGLGSPFGVAVIRVQQSANPFEQWRLSRFTTEELADETISGPNADPAGDGIGNLLKFALGLEPKTPSRHALPQPEWVDGTLRLTYPRNDVSGVVVIAEASTDLVTWNAGPDHVLIMNLGDHTGAHLAPAYAESPRVFVRLRAVLVD
jgi:hypothetical protein